MREHKGFWFQMHTIEGNMYDRSGYKHLPDMLHHLLHGGFRTNPLLEKVVLFVGPKNLGELQKEDLTMGKLDQFNATAQKTDGRPFDTKEDRQMLIAFKLPFVVRAAREVETQFKDKQGNQQNQISYDIDLDTSSPNFKMAERLSQVKTSMVLRLSSYTARLKQLKEVLEPDYIPNAIPVMLTKEGNTFILSDAE
jgi:hypothetical protein